MQLGPIYSKTLQIRGIFGVMCESIQQQVNFFIDEAAATTGKGANATISYIHYYSQHHGLGETDAHLNADNYAGQNKNNFFVWYLAWRITSMTQSYTRSVLLATQNLHQIVTLG